MQDRSLGGPKGVARGSSPSASVPAGSRRSSLPGRGFEESVRAAADSSGLEQGAHARSRYGHSLAHLEPIQRKVGFEFEAGWLVRDQQQALDWARKDEETRGPKPSPRPLKKKDKVWESSDFKVEADEAAGDESELEFILHPPAEETAAGRKDVFGRMVKMVLLGAKLVQQGGAKKQFSLKDATGSAGDERFLIEPTADKKLEARPQVTAGITLAQVAQLGGKPGGKSLDPKFARTVSTAATFRSNVDAALKKTPIEYFPQRGERADWSDDLRGLLMVVASYLSYGETAVFYPKQITDAFLLSRTDVATLYKLLPAEEKLIFAKNKKIFLRLAMAAADVTEEDQPVIGKVWTDENMTKREPIGPTREKWLSFIPLGYDLLSSAHYKEIQKEAADLGKELESMGEMGSKTEAVGEEKKAGGIFELRGAALAKEPLDLLKWPGFADSTMEYFVALSGV